MFLVFSDDYNSDDSGPTSRNKNQKKHVIESDNDGSQPSDTGLKAAMARRRGSRPFPKRSELKPSVLGDDSTEDNDHSSDEDYHLSDEDKPKKPKHRGKPAWATKPLPKKKPEYAVDRHLNGLSQKDNSNTSSQLNAAKLNHNNSNSNTSLNSNNRTPAQNGGKLDELQPPAGPSMPEVSEEDIATLESVDDLVNYVVEGDA